MIKRIELENWRSHERTVLEFSRGTNVLVGIIGSGKSSVMNAMCYALFGTFPDLQQRRLKLDDVIMNKPYQKKRARVLVAFEQDGKEYTVERVIEKGKGSVENFFRENGVLIEGPNSKRVTEKVSEVLGISYELFSKAVYSEQNNLEYFLEIPRGQRRQKIDELLGITRLERARKNSSKAVRELKQRIEILEEEAARAPSEEEVARKREEVSALERAIRELEDREAMLGKELRIAEKRLEEEERREKEHSRLSMELKREEGRALALKEKASGSSRPEKEVREDLERVRREIETARDAEEKRKALEREASRLKGVISSLEEEAEEIKEEMQGLPDPERVKARAKDLEEALVKAKTERESALTRAREIVKEIEMLSGKDTCPLCGSRVQDPERIVKEKEAEQKALEEKARELDRRIASLSREKEAVERDTRRASRRQFLASRLLRIAEEARLKREELRKAEEALATLKAGDVSALLQEESRLLKELEIAKAKTEYQEAVKRIETLKKEIEKLGHDPGRLERVRRTCEDLRAQHARTVQEITGEKRLLLEKKQALERLEKERAGALKALEEKKACEKAISRFLFLERVLAAGQDQLRKEFIAEANEALKEVWKRIYPYEDYQSLKLDVEEGDYILKLLTRGGEWVNVEGITSGGERSIACLALRIALSFVLARNLSWLVLDEPTHNLDRNSVRELARTLRESLPQIVEQVFIITHDEELEAAASGTLYVLDRKKEEDEPTRVKKEVLQDLLF